MQEKQKYSVGLQDKYESMTLLLRALVLLALLEQAGLSDLLKDSGGNWLILTCLTRGKDYILGAVVPRKCEYSTRNIASWPI